MKARVKATRRIIEVMCVMNIEGNAVWEDISGISTTPIQYTSDELEFLDFPEMPIAANIPDYWTRLEHQYAGMAMQGILSNPESELDYEGDWTLPQALAGCAAKVAHALVEKLKSESNG